MFRLLLFSIYLHFANQQRDPLKTLPAPTPKKLSSSLSVHVHYYMRSQRALTRSVINHIQYVFLFRPGTKWKSLSLCGLAYSMETFFFSFLILYIHSLNLQLFFQTYCFSVEIKQKSPVGIFNMARRRFS